MPRIRSIHPSACTSEKLAQASAEAERCYWRLQTHCDDFGKAEDHVRLIWAALFPLHETVGPDDVNRWLDDLDALGLILRYEVDGKRYLCVAGWSEKQSPRHPTPSKLPDPPPGYGETPRADSEGPEPRANPPHEKEREKEVGEGGGEGGVELTLVAPPAPHVDPIAAIFKVWQESTGHFKSVLDKKRRDAIVKARKHYPDDDLLDACRGVAISPHNQGSTNGQRYDDIALVLRDSEHVEKFRDLWRGEGRAGPLAHRVLGAIVGARGA